MNRTLNLSRGLIIFGAPLALFGVLILLMKSPLLSANSNLDLAITIDLVLTVPIVYYLLIRKESIPSTSVVPVVIAGVLIGSYFLPEDNMFYLNLFKTWGLPVIEVSVLVFIIIKIRNAVGRYKKLKANDPDFFTILKATCYEILPKAVVVPFASEIAIIYYGLIDWKAGSFGENDFTYHKKTGTTGLLSAAILIIGIETYVLHHLLAEWNMAVAWTLTILSVYTALQLLGFAKSLLKRPVSITADRMHLRYGILNEADIALTNIETVEISGRTIKQDSVTRKLSPLGELEDHNVILHLHKPVALTGIYGIKKQAEKIAFHIDDPIAFKSKVDMLLF